MTTNEAPGRLGPGEKLPRETSDADREFFARNRKLSPKFPDQSTVRLRRQTRREELAARALLFGMAASIIWSICAADWIPGAVSFVVCMVGFVAVCLAAGSRAHDRVGASGNPF